MGTDVYLEWNKQAAEEKETQVTGFAIGAGDYGYLSASIGMVRENLVLRELFPEEFWEGCESLEYVAPTCEAPKHAPQYTKL